MFLGAKKTLEQSPNFLLLKEQRTGAIKSVSCNLETTCSKITKFWCKTSKLDWFVCAGANSSKEWWIQFIIILLCLIKTCALDRSHRSEDVSKTLLGLGGYGREFESRHHILDGHFHTHICWKNCNVCLKRRKYMKKRPGSAQFWKNSCQYVIKYHTFKLSRYIVVGPLE